MSQQPSVPAAPADLGALLGPDPSSSRRPRRRTVIVAITLAVVVGAVVWMARGAASGSGYRTAAVETRSVAQILDEVGTIEPISQASVAFPVGGTVAAVNVAVGDSVVVGQELASLDTKSLETALHEQQAALAQAELTLERALAGKNVGGAAGGGPSGSTTPADGASVALTSSASTSGLSGVELVAVAPASIEDDIRAAQQAVLAAQQKVDADLLAAQAALASAEQICDAVPAPDPADPGAIEPAIQACRDALAGVLDAQRTVAASEAALADAEADLNALLDQRAAEPNVGATPPDTAGEAPAGGEDGGTVPGAGGGATTSYPSAEELVAYQKEVDAAALEVLVAEQALEQATIVSPIAGTVVAVDLAAGDEVSAGSATDAVVIKGDGGYEVTATVAVDDLPDLEVGQAAKIAPDGGDGSLDGEVVTIGQAVSSDGATAYRVTIAVVGDTSGLHNGSVASVAIQTARASDVLALPTSAVTNAGGGYTVEVLNGGEVEEIEVEVGAIGQTWTEITDGLEAGQTVVVADLDEALPGSATDGSDTTGPAGFPEGFGGGRPGG